MAAAGGEGKKERKEKGAVRRRRNEGGGGKKPQNEEQSFDEFERAGRNTDAVTADLDVTGANKVHEKRR